VSKGTHVIDVYFVGENGLKVKMLLAFLGAPCIGCSSDAKLPSHGILIGNLF